MTDSAAPEPVNDRFLTVKEFAQQIRVSPSTVRRMVRAGDVSIVNVSTKQGAVRARIRETEVARWIRDHAIPRTTSPGVCPVELKPDGATPTTTEETTP